MGLQSKKSPAVRLQLLLCSSLTEPAAQKISSSQIAVAALQPSYWVCRHKMSSTLSYWACHQQILKINCSQSAKPKKLPECTMDQHYFVHLCPCQCKWLETHVHPGNMLDWEHGFNLKASLFWQKLNLSFTIPISLDRKR